MFSEQNVIETVAPHDTNITITQGRLSKHKGHLRACQSVNWSIAKVLCCRSNQVGFKNAHEREQKVKKREKQSRKTCKKAYIMLSALPLLPRTPRGKEMVEHHMVHA